MVDPAHPGRRLSADDDAPQRRLVGADEPRGAQVPPLLRLPRRRRRGRGRRGLPGLDRQRARHLHNYPAQVGNSQFALEASGFGPGAITLQAFGLLPNYPAIPIPGAPGCTLQTNLDVVLSGVAGTGGVRDQTASGHVRTPFPIPGSPVLSGFYFTSQMAGIDLGLANPLPVVTTNTLQITVN